MGRTSSAVLPDGYGETVKRLELVPVPTGVTTLIGPVVAPAGTVAVIFAEELTTNVAAVPLKATAVAPAKFTPLMVTDVPTRPLFGVKLVIAGNPVNVEVLEAVPAGVFTLMTPVVLPAGTTAEICTLESTVKAAPTPLNVTEDAPPKFAPLIVTRAPAGALVGENDAIEGNGLKFEGVLAVPLGVITMIRPVVASAGTSVVIRVAESIVKLAFAPLKVTAVVSR
jgi:hypothetical protein